MTLRPVVVFADNVGMALTADALPVGCPYLQVADPARTACPPADGRTVFHHPSKVNREAFVARLAALRPVLGIVCSYSRLLWPELLTMFPHGVVNLHGGPLPTYRGANVLQWVLINGERETAVSLHYVDEGIDTGPVIDARTVSIDDDDDAVSLRIKLCDTGRELLRRHLSDLLAGAVPAKAQDESRARRWPRRKPEDGWIDWSQSDEQIRNLTRALVAPWPGAMTVNRDGSPLVFRRALSLDDVATLRAELGHSAPP